MSLTEIPSSKPLLDRTHTTLAILVATGTILAGLAVSTWKLMVWVNRVNEISATQQKLGEVVTKLKEENDDLKQFIRRQSEVTLASAPQGGSTHPVGGENPPQVSGKSSGYPSTVNDLIGSWELTFSKGKRARVGLVARTDAIGEFHGEIPQTGGLPSLRLEGRAALTGRIVNVKFLTRSDDGRNWQGEGTFKIQGRDFLQGWYVDQNGEFDTIDIKRIP
jgi:hypothetical protein